MQSNPFTLTFGIEPRTLIGKSNQFDSIKSNFLSDYPTTSTYLITGIRGAGKTVLLTRLYKYFSSLEDWIVVELNPEMDMMEYLASSLYESITQKFKFLKKDFSFSFYGLSFSISGEKPVSNVVTLLEKMFEILTKQNKKVLICVDDVSNNANIKTFVQQYQIFLRKDYPLFLLMTGLFENVRNLQNEKSLTFLYRAIQINVDPLNLIDIAKSFEKILNVDRATAIKMANLTKGYAFAYQVLGYLFFESDKKELNDDLIEQFDAYLRDYVYEKVYYDLTSSEKRFVDSLAASSRGEIKQILIALNTNKETISPLRDRLLKKGIIVKTDWGKVGFSLPRFKEFVSERNEFFLDD